MGKKVKDDGPLQRMYHNSEGKKKEDSNTVAKSRWTMAIVGVVAFIIVAALLSLAALYSTSLSTAKKVAEVATESSASTVCNYNAVDLHGNSLSADFTISSEGFVNGYAGINSNTQLFTFTSGMLLIGTQVYQIDEGAVTVETITIGYFKNQKFTASPSMICKKEK